MRVHGAGIDEVFVLPNVLQQLFARLDTPATLRQHGQQFELRRGQLDAFALHCHPVPRHVDDQIAELIPVFFLIFTLAPLEEIFHPQEQFARAEWLGHIIVRAQFQAEHAVDLRRFCSEHDDANAGGGRVATQNFANFNTVHFRQHQIENNQIGRVSPGLFQRFRAVRRRHDFVTRALEIELNQFNSVGFVIYHQNLCHHTGFGYHEAQVPTISAR